MVILKCLWIFINVTKCYDILRYTVILYVTFLFEIYEEGQDNFFSDASDGCVAVLEESGNISPSLFLICYLTFSQFLSTFCSFVSSSCYILVVYYI